MVDFLFCLDVNTIYYIHIQLFILIIPYAIESESKKLRSDKQNGYRGDVVQFSVQLFEINNILKQLYFMAEALKINLNKLIPQWMMDKVATLCICKQL